MKAENNMPDEFFDWLGKCPVVWYRRSIDKHEIQYAFIVPEKENTDNG